MNDLYRQKLEKENQELVKKLECLDRFKKLEEENYHLHGQITNLNRNIEDLVEKLNTQDKTIDYLEEIIKNPKRCEDYRMRSNYLEAKQRAIDKCVNEPFMSHSLEDFYERHI